MLSMIIFTNVLKLNSIYSCDIGFAITTLMILYKKPILIKKAVISGLCMIVIAIIGYAILLTIYPNLINDWWQIKNISGLFILGIPIEEIIWFGLFGLSIGPIYDFWRG